jgi:hypothetical protein
MGLGRVTSESIIHSDLHKPNNKLVNHGWSTFGALIHHEQTQIHKTHHDLNFGEVTTFPLIVFSVPGHGASTQMSFCPGTPKLES